MSRLVDYEELSVNQKLMVSRLLDAEGECCCGMKMTALSAKFILGNLISEHPKDKKKRGCLIMAAYCYSCFQELNSFLKYLKNKGGINGRKTQA